MSEDNILDALQGDAKPGACVLTVSNQCPASWGIVITIVAFQFTYKDGKTGKATYPDRILAGETKTYHADNNCLVKHVCGVRVQAPDGDSAYTKDGEAPPGQCTISSNFSIGPAKSIDEKVLGSAKSISAFIELYQS